MIRSGGVLVKSRLWTPLDWNGIPQPGITQAFRWGSYDSIYRSHLWVSVLVNKIANAAARLPLKVYERDDNDGRIVAAGNPYHELLRNPHPTLDPYSFWVWVFSTLNVYGEAFLLKDRDRGGRPVALHPIHPTAVKYDDGKWSFMRSVNGSPVDVSVQRRDLVHFRMWDPTDNLRGMSPLEPLRSTLENEAGARAASNGIFANGARPSVALKHPGVLSDGAQQRLKANWDSVYSGASNFGKTAILEEGMEAQILTFTADELQYIGSRQLNREECCAQFDIPPPVVHILDRATFSNITEQMRSMYRDSMAPKLNLVEATLEKELRDGSMGTRKSPDFSEDVYAEFLMDDVLRGDFETRATAYQAGINSGWMMPSEVRRAENLPFIDGSDQLLVNSTIVPLDAAGQAQLPAPTPQLPAGRTLPDDAVIRRHVAGIEKRMLELESETP